MANRYGHRWTSAYGDVPNDSWREETQGLSEQEWLQGIQKVKDASDEWPPSLPEFLNGCRGVLSEKEAKAQALIDWENRPAPAYSPWNPGKTYQQIEADKREFMAKRVIELTAGAERQAIGLGHDLVRVCQDEELR